MPYRSGTAPVALLIALLIAAVPSLARADDERVMFGAEASLLVPTTPLASSAYATGATAAIAAQLSLTKWLMPTLRLRAGVLGAGQRSANADGALGSIGSITTGLRFRPRGIAHPEETPRATCVWAEIDAGIALWISSVRPTFEAAVGFTFAAGEVDIGPVFRFVHVMATSDGTDAYLVTVGLELMLGDAR